MVIQEDHSTISLESGVQKMESKKYVVVKNHVREITDNSAGCSTSKERQKCIENPEKDSKNKKTKNQRSSSSEDGDVLSSECKNDLQELKSVYKKCKALLMNIESKYGHFLNLDSENEIGNSRKRKNSVNSDEQCECNCTSNKKIVFNDDGQQVFEEGYSLQNHICPKKLKCYNRRYLEKYPKIQIEHESLHNNLPETIQQLNELLKNPLIKNSLRNSIIEKIKNIRQEHLNMIRFDRETLIEKLKSNPEEIIDFKGTNISSLTGYPTK